MRLRTLFAALGLFLAMGTVGVAAAAAATNGNPKWHLGTQDSPGASAILLQADGKPKWHRGTQDSSGV